MLASVTMTKKSHVMGMKSTRIKKKEKFTGIKNKNIKQGLKKLQGLKVK